MDSIGFPDAHQEAARTPLKMVSTGLTFLLQTFEAYFSYFVSSQFFHDILIKIIIILCP